MFTNNYLKITKATFSAIKPYYSLSVALLKKILTPSVPSVPSNHVESPAEIKHLNNNERSPVNHGGR